MKPKLLVFELWVMGDLAVATPFLRAAAKVFEVTLLAKPLARELQPHLWPSVEVIPFVFPWTAFRGKYRLLHWPWHGLGGVVGELRRRRFDAGVSARWDPREHLLLGMSGARRRVGFPRLGSGAFLTDRLTLPPGRHRYDCWRVAARQLGMEMPPRQEAVPLVDRRGGILLHTGAGQPTRVWPLERYTFVARQLRGEGYAVELVCDATQREKWIALGENPSTPATIAEYLAILQRTALFVGNDSGPGHLAGILGIPTFTIFGPQLPALFAPMGAAAEWIEGAPCVYKPCWDACRFARPECLLAIEENQVWQKLRPFAAKHLRK